MFFGFIPTPIDKFCYIKMKELRKYPPKLFHSTDAKDAFKIASETKFSTLMLKNHTSTDPVFNPFYNLFESTGKT